MVGIAFGVQIGNDTYKYFTRATSFSASRPGRSPKFSGEALDSSAEKLV